jgi:hypothetical protein
MNSIASLNWGLIGGVLLTGSFIVGGDGDPIATPVMLASAARTSATTSALLPEGDAAVYPQPAPVVDRRIAAEAAMALRQAGITPERLAIAGGSINDLHAALAGAISQASIDPEQLLAASSVSTRRSSQASNFRHLLRPPHQVKEAWPQRGQLRPCQVPPWPPPPILRLR